MLPYPIAISRACANHSDHSSPSSSNAGAAWGKGGKGASKAPKGRTNNKKGGGGKTVPAVRRNELTGAPVLAKAPDEPEEWLPPASLPYEFAGYYPNRRDFEQVGGSSLLASIFSLSLSPLYLVVLEHFMFIDTALFCLFARASFPPICSPCFSYMN